MLQQTVTSISGYRKAYPLSGMTMNFFVRIIFFYFCVLWLSQPAPVNAQSADEPPLTAIHFKFKIQEQPLKSALDLYAAMTGVEILYDAGTVTGKSAKGIDGEMTKETAIAALLDGTHLRVRSIAADAFTIEAFTVQPRPQPPLDAATYNFTAALQDTVENKLCENQLSVPGSYRAAVELLIDGSGVIGQARLLSSTGNKDRDAAVAKQLTQISVGERSPTKAIGRTVVVILPRASSAKGGCHPFASSRAGR